MAIIQEQEECAKGQTVSDEYRSRVFSHMPAVGRLLDALDAGETPNFLDIMSAISEEVAFYTECDHIESVECLRFSEMSGNKCLFCC